MNGVNDVLGFPGEQMEGPEDPPHKRDAENRRFERLRPVPWSEVAMRPPPEWLVKGVMIQDGISYIYGKPGSGKSFIAIDLGARIALGWDWCGRPVLQGGVLYIIGEGQGGFPTRLTAFEQHHGISMEEKPIRFIEAAADLRSSSKDAEYIIEWIGTLPDAYGLRLIVVDTLSAALHGGSDTDDMGDLLATCRMLKERTGAHILLIHHPGKDESRGARGGSNLRGDTDHGAVVEKAGDIVTMKTEKSRDGDDSLTFAFKIEPIELGQDAEGDPIVSRVAVQTDPRPTAHKKQGPSPRNRRALNALQDLVVDEGKPSPGGKHFPEGVRVVTEDQWREYLKRACIIKGDDKNPRTTYKRISDGLADGGYIGMWDGLVWTCQQPSDLP